MNGFITKNKIEKHLKEYPCNYDIILGMRSNGKSCGVKSYCVDRSFRKGEQFFYLRRNDNDLKNWQVESYFKNVEGFDVRKLTKGEYEHIGAKQGTLYFYNTEIKNNKEVRVWGDQCGYFGSLSTSTHLKSLNFPETKYIIFEEFVTDKVYLPDECNLLFNVVSTIFRNQNGVVFMVANTISEINPYFREFELTNINSQPLGTVDTYLLDSTKVNVWLTAPLADDITDNNNMVFGNRSKMIKNGEWQRDRKRRLEQPYHSYTCAYTMVFVFDQYKFLMELLVDEKNKGVIWYVTRKTSDIQPKTRIVSDQLVENINTTIGFVPLTEGEKLIFPLLQQGKIAYQDNLIGTQFIQCFNQLKTGLQ